MLPSPALMQLEAQNSNLVEEVDGQGNDERSVHNISDMPDHDGIYSSTLGTANVSKCFIAMPNIRDGNGALIRPDEYEHKMRTGDIA